MPINSEIKQPVRVYDSTNKQFFNRNPYLNDINIPCVIINKDRFLPLTLTRNANSASINSVKLIDMDNCESKNLANMFTFIRLTNNVQDYILYKANTDLAESLPLGIYYMEISDGTNTWYTDHFIIDHFSETIELEYYNTRDMAGFIYQQSFKNRFKVLGFIQDNGDYKEYKETTKDINYNEKTTYHRKQKLYQLILLTNSVLYDCLQIMAIHNTINLTNRLNETSQIEITEITPTRYDGTGYMKVVIKFQVKDDYYVYDETAQNEALHYKLLATKLGKYVVTKKGQKFKVRI